MAGAPTILDNLIAENLISPTVAVLVSEIDREARSKELPANADFADFMAKKLLPEIKARTGLKLGPDRTILAGSSYGGLPVQWAFWRRRDICATCLSRAAIR